MGNNWEEATYTVNKILNGIDSKIVSGIPPKNMSYFYAIPGNKTVTLKYDLPADTYIDGQLICTVKGVRIVKKQGSAPIGPEDGLIILEKDRVNYLGPENYTDKDVSNGIAYYYGFFPYSDHGIYNFNEVNILRAIPSAIKYWAFDQNFADKNPLTTITYPSDFQNSSYTKMMTNEGQGTATAGSWLSFLQTVLKNYPYMVKRNGKIDYALSPGDYTKKDDGSSPSDYSNQLYNGGAFAWINKIYMKETYSSDGNSREVQFADKAADGFSPVGFYDFDENELEGIWLPMGYMDANGTSIVSGTTPISNHTCAEEKALIDAFSERAVFLGGPILRVLRDLEYMLFKTTDIQLYAGNGRSNSSILANAAVPNGNVQGWKGTNTKNVMNKYFHSQVLGSYQVALRDPYTILIAGKMYANPYYQYSLEAAKYTDTGIAITTNSAWTYPTHMTKMGTNLGSIPKQASTGSTSTGLCDGYPQGNASGTRVSRTLGYYNGNMVDGPANVSFYYADTDKRATGGAAILLLPPVGYTPS
jgi:hypothetical protein